MCASIPRSRFLLLWSFKMMKGRPNSSNAKAGVTLMSASSIVCDTWRITWYLVYGNVLSCTAYVYDPLPRGRDFKKMSSSGEGEELAAKKAASPLYLGFDFSTQQVKMTSLYAL